jgi:hypothetical protein
VWFGIDLRERYGDFSTGFPSVFQHIHLSLELFDSDSFMWKLMSVKYDSFVIHEIPGSARGLEVKIRFRLNRQQDYFFHKQPSAYRIKPASTGGSYMVSPWSHEPGLLVLALRSTKIQLHNKAKREIYSTVSITSHITKFDRADNVSTPKAVLYPGGPSH